ncbi:MAG: 4-hydroxythreonine-4-phosphate dehydrogenase PdxA [Paludibacteraceae bacterium]|nr:4-hydroxythreonine-4-phosphate dehydrogenase PdxA [Paludibacteraceae bacterium]
MKPIVAITAGDPNGVGYEVIIKTLADPHIVEVCTPVLYGNAAIAWQHAQRLGEEFTNMQWNIVPNAAKAQEGKLNLVSCYPNQTPLSIGLNTKDGGKAALLSLQAATRDIKSNFTRILVTAPINKENIQQDGFHFSGHTEYLTEQFGSKDGSLMMMVSDVMRIALVTNHLPISQVASHINQETVLHKLRVLNRALKEDFTLQQPRIAVLALNPHAGDNGLLGSEEKEILQPAIKHTKIDIDNPSDTDDRDLCVFGPYAADGFFGAGKYVHFDAVLAMYHDQGLAPFKTLDMNGVNFTAGLNIVRTSPDHGTAFDIAGKNEANPLSFRHALFLALDINQRRQMNAEIKANPLKIEPREERPQRKPLFVE